MRLVLLLFTMTTTISRTVKYLIWQMERFWIIHFSLRLFEIWCIHTYAPRLYYVNLIYIYIMIHAPIFFGENSLKSHWMITVMHWSPPRGWLANTSSTYLALSSSSPTFAPCVARLSTVWHCWNLGVAWGCCIDGRYRTFVCECSNCLEKKCRSFPDQKERIAARWFDLNTHMI